MASKTTNAADIDSDNVIKSQPDDGRGEMSGGGAKGWGMKWC